MRLTQIKLSGFKSFVDPTHFAIPGQLVGVVGPNGCGKSNIIDAARWVLGESKASELRGESMQDVIFNGSGLRKPAGRASVELIFDNPPSTHGKGAGGQWAQYAEIAVKRVLTRDGTSTYLINNQVVRRRDIQDIFLGTGLGPRAYAIIGQGMIGRIIEARPEELRVFLEEAAGVSKYKERRRETENRLSDTRENLTRVEDILRELNAHLDKLEGQAVIAQQYRDLQAEADDKQQLSWALRAGEAAEDQARHGRDVEKAKNELEARTADLRRAEAQLERLRAAHHAGGEAVHLAQSELYEASSAVAAIEAEIRFVVESRNRLQTQVSQLDAQREQWVLQASQHETALADVAAALDAATAAIATTQSRLDEHAAALPDIEQGVSLGERELEALRGEATNVAQTLQIEATHQRNADRNLSALAVRRERLADERHSLARPETSRLASLNSETDDGARRLSDASAELASIEASFPSVQAARSVAHEVLSREAGLAAQIDAKLTALKHLQERVATHGKLQPWLDKHELARLPRLWQRLHIEAGWETALEAVLRERIAALEITQLDLVKAFFDDAPPAKLAFFSDRQTGSAPALVPNGLISLLSLIELRDPALRTLLADWIGDIYIAESAAVALERRTELPPGASFVLKGGHLIGRHALQFYASDSEQAGMLARQQEIESLGKQSRAQALLTDAARGHAVRSDAALTAAGASLAALRRDVGVLTASVHARQLELQKLMQADEQSRARGGQIDAELGDIATEGAKENAVKTASEESFQRLDLALADVQTRVEEAQANFDTGRARLEAAQTSARDLERLVQEAQFIEREKNIRINELNSNIKVSNEQSERARLDLEKLHVELVLLSDEAARAGLQEAIAVRIGRESRLADVRAELDALTGQLRGADEARLTAERDLEPLRACIAELQLKEQAARLTHEQYAQQLADAGADAGALAVRLASETGSRQKPGALHAEVQRLHQAIAALGAVNLAALDELTTARERKTFLDAQFADLHEAIATLEDAIRKIDRETRALLQDTFDAVNRHFNELFPALFGGGEARLVMTGDEILDSGVQVLAQPPGKKNSTIHLLSGGEKALTAIALVFALFQLNPAPFCLLDEVDAPLDDANTERFCKLVRKMSSETQFLFISHNKIAMEMAQQLIGVTMQEQGVSRVVAVDLDAAAAFANETIGEAA